MDKSTVAVKDNETTKYLPQLDGLRAIAVLLVVAGHWVGLNFFMIFSPRSGVLLFFMLSGYLITGILLDRRQESLHSQPLRLHVWRSFFMRRVLRIFPLFYAVLLFLFLFDAAEVREHVWWHATYLSNLLMAFMDKWTETTAHFWSLAIEEQFYLFWPFVILFLPGRHLKPLLIAFLVSAPLFRWLIYLAGGTEVAVWVLPFSVLDSLGMGALFALLQRSSLFSRSMLQRFSFVLSLAGLLMVITLYSLHFSSLSTGLTELLISVFLDSSVVLSFSGLLVYVSLRNRGWLLAVLKWSPLVYLGKISYGIYLFHLPVKALSWRLFEFSGALDLYNSLNPAVLVIIWSVLTLSLSIISWQYFESKLNALKRHFPYLPKHSPKPKTRAVTAS